MNFTKNYLTVYQNTIFGSIALHITFSLISCTTTVTSPSTPVPSTLASNPSSPAPLEISSPYDFSQLCNGIALEAAPSYSKEAGSRSIAVFEQKNQQSPFEPNHSQFPKSWEVNDNNAKNNQLVVCIRIASQELNKKCSGYEVSSEKTGEKKKATIELYDAIYNVILYEAKTAKVIESRTFALKNDDDCPPFAFFENQNSLIKKEYPKYEQIVIDLIKPYMQI